MRQSPKPFIDKTEALARPDNAPHRALHKPNGIQEPHHLQLNSDEGGAERFMMILEELHHVVDAVSSLQNILQNLTYQIGSLAGQTATLHIEMGGVRSDIAHLSQRLNELSHNR